MSRPSNIEWNASPAVALTSWLDRDDSRHASWVKARAMLNDIAESAAGTGELSRLAEVTRLMARLMEIVETQTPFDAAPTEDLKDILGFVQSNARIVIDAVERDALVAAPLLEMIDQARERWGDCLNAMEGDRTADFADEMSVGSSTSEPLDMIPESLDLDPATRAEQLSMMLTAIAESEDELPAPAAAAQETPPPRQPQSVPSSGIDRIAQVQLDDDLRDAFTQDANRCLGSIEKAALELEVHPRQAKHRRQICRELHTLKGASASVGLDSLAQFLHQVEESVARNSASDQDFDFDQLLKAVDMVRRQVVVFGRESAQHRGERSIRSPDEDAAPPTANAMSALNPVSDADGQASVRVRASKLDRLMDMLAELVVLRNRRETQVDELNLLNQELIHCAARVKQFSDRNMNAKQVGAENGQRQGSNGSLAGLAEFGLDNSVRDGGNMRALAEIANDLGEIARGIKDFYRPIAEENVALTHFIRQFRQEMMQLRRLPVSGLFQRLQRAARDAARMEGKQIQVQFLGHQTAVEQSLQEKLYEPLLHIVRNAVSHGIEDTASRSAGGKSAVGQVVLQISSSANLLGINVSDDGRGLDYDALRRRGYEQGLLSPERSPTRQELAKLIFHPGFSTRDTANAVSGRGVGMDVVATAIDRLHGRIEIDSTPGRGTSIRLSIPLGSGIEHAMIFRAAGQQFALPMYSVSAAHNSTGTGASSIHAVESRGATRSVSFSRIASLPDSESPAGNRLLILELDSGNRGPAGRVNLIVDDIVGGEEVVVRALPRNLKHHPLVGGVTLSGGGEMVLTIDPTRLSELCRLHLADETPADSLPAHAPRPQTAAKRVLVVDDSLSARRSLVKRLARHGLEIVEACDGMEALDCLRFDSFQLVITDLDMPRLGGLDLLGEIRQRHVPDTPLVVVSSRTEVAIREQAIRRGAQAFVNKPVTDESLADLLQQFRLLEV